MTAVLSHIAGAPIRTRRPRNREEDGIQASIVEYLRLVLPKGKYKCFSIANEGKRSLALGRRLKDMGLLAGVPDIEVLGPGGRSWFFEVKTDQGRPSEAQRDFQKFCIVNAVPHAIVRSIDDASRALVEWGLKRGSA